MLNDVLSVPNANKYIIFEEQVEIDYTSFIGDYINITYVMIAHKSLGKDFRKGIKLFNSSILSPFQQAKLYASKLLYSKYPS